MKGDLLAMENQKLNSKISKSIKSVKYLKNIFFYVCSPSLQPETLVEREIGPN